MQMAPSSCAGMPHVSVVSIYLFYSFIPIDKNRQQFDSLVQQYTPTSLISHACIEPSFFLIIFFSLFASTSCRQKFSSRIPTWSWELGTTPFRKNDQLCHCTPHHLRLNLRVGAVLVLYLLDGLRRLIQPLVILTMSVCRTIDLFDLFGTYHSFSFVNRTTKTKDALSLNPQATWDDPRLNPSLYPNHDPSLHYHQLTANSRSKTQTRQQQQQLPSVTLPAPLLPLVKVYPDYPQPHASGDAAILSAAGAAVAAGMVCRQVGSKQS